MNYTKNLSHNQLNAYIAKLINKVYRVLPIYEEDGKTEQLSNKIDGLLRCIDGFLCSYQCDEDLSLDIISYMQELQFADTHEEIRSCVLKVCNLLDKIKVGD